VRWGAGLTGAAVVIGVAVVALALDGGSTTATPTSSAPPTTAGPTTTAVVTTTTEPDRGPVAPLTGLRVGDPALMGRPALAVKIDNLDMPGESALPQAGLSRADVVFEEVVEGNITRLVAVFHSKQPGRVGPVRSARTTDVHLLPQFGRILLAWSGGNDGVKAAVRASGSLIDVGHDAATPSYSRDRSRRAPHNLFVDGDSLWSRTPAGTGPPPALFQYRAPGQAQPSTSQAAAGVDLSWGAGAATAPVNWRWDPAIRLYVRSQAGRPHTDADGTRITAKNVVVMVTDYGRSAADSRSPEAHVVGSGEAFVYTEGRVIYGRWGRVVEGKPASLFDAKHAPVLLTPGQTWVELPKAGGVTTVKP
jgi:hypothetical protein